MHLCIKNQNINTNACLERSQKCLIFACIFEPWWPPFRSRVGTVLAAFSEKWCSGAVLGRDVAQPSHKRPSYLRKNAKDAPRSPQDTFRTSPRSLKAPRDLPSPRWISRLIVGSLLWPGGMREAIRRPTGTACWIVGSRSSYPPRSFQSQVPDIKSPASLSQTLSRRLRIPPGRPQVYEDFGSWRLLGRKSCLPRGLQKLIKF